MTTHFDNIKDFINRLPKKSTDAYKADKIKEYILNIDCKDNTKSSLITKTKKYIVDNTLFKNNDNLNILNARELYDKLIKENYQKRKERLVVDIDIEDIDKIFNLKNAKKTMNDKGVYEIDFYATYCYLLATSGLRTNELWDNSFEIVNTNTIKPKRISKINADTTPNDAVVYLIVDAKEWLRLFNELQNYIKVHQPKYGSTIFSGIKRKLENISPTLTGHTLRKLFVAYHRQVLKTDPDNLPSVSTARLLNHQGEHASNYYNGAVKISGDIRDVIDRTDYTKYTIAKLKDVLTSKNISFTSKMKKNELISLIPV